MRTGIRLPSRCPPGVAVVAACVVALVLAACQPAPPEPSNVTPGKAVATNLRLTAMGDFDGLMKNRLPAGDYAIWRTEWQQEQAHPFPATVAQEQQFAKIMQMLTEPGAEEKLARRLLPGLAGLQGKGAPMPIFVGILAAAGQQAIADAPQLGPAQRAFASQGLDAVVDWARTADFSDPKKARKAIDLACATARQLHVQTLAQWRALSYPATMKNYGIIWNGLESLLNMYGLDLAGALHDAKTSTVTSDGTHATVKVEMTLAGKPLTAEWPMLKQQGHWYDAAVLEAWRKAHPASPGSAAVPAQAVSAAGAGTVPAAVAASPASAGS